MTSDDNSNLAAVDDPATPDDRVVGGRASPDEIYLLDRAALEVGKRRGPFIVEAAVAEARRVLAAKSVLDNGSPAAA